MVEWETLDLLEKAYLAGNPIECLKDFAKTATTWNQWLMDMNEIIGDDNVEE